MGGEILIAMVAERDNSTRNLTLIGAHFRTRSQSFTDRKGHLTRGQGS